MIFIPEETSLIEFLTVAVNNYSLQSRMNKGRICEAGRKDTIGRPILFRTTDEFLSHFGLEGLEGLPPMPQPPEEQSGQDTETEELIP